MSGQIPEKQRLTFEKRRATEKKINNLSLTDLFNIAGSEYSINLTKQLIKELLVTWDCSCGAKNITDESKCQSCGKQRENSQKSKLEISEESDNPLSCKICFDADVQARLPCGHMATCTVCALRMNSCPICRKDYNPDTDVQTTYIS